MRWLILWIVLLALIVNVDMVERMEGDSCTKSADCGDAKLLCNPATKKCIDGSKTATTQISEKDKEYDKKKVQAAQDRRYVDFRNKQNKAGQKGTEGSRRYWANLNKDNPEFKAKGVKGTEGSKKWWARQQRIKKGGCKTNSECKDGKVCKKKKCVSVSRYGPKTPESDAAWAASGKSDFKGEAGDFCVKPSDCTLDGYDPAVWEPTCYNTVCTVKRTDGKPGAADNVNRTNRLQGQTCGVDGECTTGLSCEIVRGENRKRCTGTKQTGEECVKDNDCTSRGYDQQIYKTYCLQKRCHTRIKDSERLLRNQQKKKVFSTPCTQGSECASGVCKNSKCAGPDDSSVYMTLLKKGDRCRNNFECVTKNCVNKKCAYTTPNSTPAPQPATESTESTPAPVGQSSLRTALDVMLDVALTQGKKVKDGARCTRNIQCASKVCSNNKCSIRVNPPPAPQKKAQGEACTEVSECQPLTDAEKSNGPGRKPSKMACELGKCKRIDDITAPTEAGVRPAEYSIPPAGGPPAWSGSPDPPALVQDTVINAVKDAAETVGNALADVFGPGSTFSDSNASQFK